MSFVPSVRRARSPLLVLAACVACGALGSVALRALPSRGASSTTSNAASGVRLGFPAQSVQVYAFSVQRSETSDLEALGLPPVHAEVDLAGELEVRAYGNDVLGVRVVRFDRHVFTFGDKALLDDGVSAQLLGQEAFAHVENGAQPKKLLFAHDATPVFRLVAQHLLFALAADVPKGAADEWTVRDQGPLGVGPAHYAVERPSGVIVRTRASYEQLASLPPLLGAPTQKLASLTRIEHRDDGVPLRIEGKEELDATVVAEKQVHTHAKATGSLRHLRSRPLDAALPELASLSERPFGEAVGEADSRADLERQKAEALTVEQFDGILDDVASGNELDVGLKHDIADWLPHHEGMADKIAALIERPTLTKATRLRLLDLLVECGTPEAQQAAMRALGQPSLRAPELWRAAMGRISLFQRPTPELLEFVHAQYVGQRGVGSNDARPTVIAYGSLLGFAVRSGQAVDLDKLTAPMKDDLRRERTPEGKRALLSALGNAGAKGDVRDITKYARDGDPAVREMAVHALRANARDCVDTLSASLGDSSGAVARTAIDVLRTVELSEQQAQAMSETLAHGGANGDIDAALASYVAESPAMRPYAAMILPVLLAREEGNPETAAHIRRLMERPRG